MRKRKRILSTLLALCIVFGMLPTAALADTSTSGTCGENLTWTLESGVLTIRGTGGMWNYSRDSNHNSTAP